MVCSFGKLPGILRTGILVNNNLFPIAAAIALLCLAAPPAQADWLRLRDTDQSVVYVDPTTIEKNAGTLKLWELEDLKASAADGTRSRRALREYDCQGERLRSLSEERHAGQMASGEILSASNRPGEWETPAAAEPVWVKLRALCNL